MRKIGVVLLSGGLDSTTVAACALKEGYELTALTFQYGQKHSREVESARKVAEVMGIKWEIVDFSFYKRLAWYSALTSSGNFQVPRRMSREDTTSDIPITYVPLRNTFFITVAAAFLESEVLSLIETGTINPVDVETSIFIGVNAIDYSGYPDCRPEYYEKMSEVLFQGSKLGAQYGKPIIIRTPIINMTKAEIVKLACELNTPLEYTWSCYEGEDVPCRKCDSCILRARGFAEAGYDDPLLLRLEKDDKIAESKQVP